MSKDYRNPAMKFLSQNNADTEVEELPKKRGPKPSNREKKSKPINLVLKPSVHEEFKKIAYMQQSSVNNLIGEIMEQYIKDHQEDIQKYNDMFEK